MPSPNPLIHHGPDPYIRLCHQRPGREDCGCSHRDCWSSICSYRRHSAGVSDDAPWSRCVEREALGRPPGNPRPSLPPPGKQAPGPTSERSGASRTRQRSSASCRSTGTSSSTATTGTCFRASKLTAIITGTRTFHRSVNTYFVSSYLALTSCVGASKVHESRKRP